jgi:hypothetical protein
MKITYIFFLRSLLYVSYDYTSLTVPTRADNEFVQLA